MYVKMLKTIAKPGQALRFRHTYELPDAEGEELVRKNYAEASALPPPHIGNLLDRLEDGAGKPCLFLPFVGEFGHLVMSHMRFVHFHKASEKVVCCRPGEEVLFPSVKGFVTDWTDPVADVDRVGTMRDTVYDWSSMIAKFPGYHPVRVGGLTFQQEIHCIQPEEKIVLRPKKRKLKADVVFGVRTRQFAPEKNWQHWQRVADAVRAAGFTFAVVGARDTAQNLDGQTVHSGDLDTDAAVELLQKCRLYVGTDSGGSHLASVVGSRMLVFREPRNGMRDFVPRMQLTNPGKVEFLPAGWDDPQAVIDRTLQYLRGEVEPPSVHYTAQHGEDRWIARHFKSLGLPKKGIFVEVGVADGIHLSNTHWLEKEMGWTGLLVEPHPLFVRMIPANRQESILEPVAAGSVVGEADFHLMPIAEHSGFTREGGKAEKIQVETLTALLDKHKIDRIDVLSLDTEGTELDAWAGLDLSRWRPKLVIIEWDTVGLPDNRLAIIRRMTTDRYQLIETLGGNLLFVDADRYAVDVKDLDVTTDSSPSTWREFQPGKVIITPKN